jgi:AcrR family transcriptional regulator
MTDEIKAQILAAAAAVFAEKGFANAGINDIVRASGLSKGGVYWHFASKDEIVTAIFNQFFEEQLSALEILITQMDLSATEKLLQLARESGQGIEALAAHFPSSLEFYALAARNEALRMRLAHYFGRYEDMIRRVIEQGIAAGEWRPVDTGATAQAVIALFEGVLLVNSVLPATVSLETRLASALMLLIEGLKRTE